MSGTARHRTPRRMLRPPLKATPPRWSSPPIPLRLRSTATPSRSPPRSAANQTLETPTGSVQFVIDGQDYGSAVAIDAGTASIIVSGLHAGDHQVGAVYYSDSAYFLDSEAAPPLDFHVTPAMPTFSAKFDFGTTSSPVKPVTHGSRTRRSTRPRRNTAGRAARSAPRTPRSGRPWTAM